MTTPPPGQPPSRGRIYVSASRGPAAAGAPVGPAPAGPPPVAATGSVNPLAVLSLVFAFVFSPLGIVLGHVAKRQIRRNRQSGDGIATAGLVIGYLSLALDLIAGAYLAAPTTTGMPLWKALVLGIVEGVTEFLPVSSTGHLTISEKLLSLRVDDPGVTAYTAIIQVGAIIAAIIYFRRDIVRIVVGLFRGLVSAEGRRSPDWRMALYVIVGSIPVAVVGLGAKSLIEGAFRSLWVVSGALILWSAVMVVAEARATQTRHEDELRWLDAIVIGVAQCFALIPGVSRSGATISAGLLRGLDRVTATRLSFFLGIPALTAAGGLEAVTRRHDIAAGVGWTPTLVGTVVSFIVAYASIAWLLKFVAHHSIVNFVWYRVALGAVILVALATGALAAT